MPITSFAVELSEANIHKLLNDADTAITNGDIDGYASLLSDDARFILKFIMQGRQQALPYSKSRYINIVRESLAAMDEYAYTTSNLVIKIMDNKATATGDVTELITINGRTTIAESTSEVTIEVVNGALLFTTLSGELHALTRG